MSKMIYANTPPYGTDDEMKVVDQDADAIRKYRAKQAAEIDAERMLREGVTVPFRELAEEMRKSYAGLNEANEWQTERILGEIETLRKSVDECKEIMNRIVNRRVLGVRRNEH